MDSHSVIDFIRDTVSEFVAGVLVVAVGGTVALFRHIRNRLNRHGNEIRHTQSEAEIKPLYPEYPADKL